MKSSRYIIASAATILIVAALAPMTMNAAPAPSRFVLKDSKVLLEVMIGPDGGVLHPPARDARLHGIRIVIPKNALPAATTIRLMEDEGTLTVRSGKPAGVVLRLDAGNRNSFEQPVEMEIPNPGMKATVIGYAIDDDGFLAPLMVSKFDRAKERVILSTLVPVRFTWVFGEAK